MNFHSAVRAGRHDFPNERPSGLCDGELSMGRLRLQKAVTHILTSYLASHQIGVGQVPGLVTSLGQALSIQPPSREADAVVL